MNFQRLSLFGCVALVVLSAGFSLYTYYHDRMLVLDHHGFRHEPNTQYDHSLGYRLKKNISMNGFRHNSYGYVGPEFKKTKPEGTFRIFCLGGSTTLGAGVDTDAHAYPALLQSMFDSIKTDASQSVEVINAGVFGYRSLHTSVLISEILDEYQPDMYIIMDGLNDLDTAKALTLSQLRKASGRPGDAMTDGHGLQDIEAKFELVGYRENLQKAIDHARARGIAVIVVSDPMRIGADNRARLSGDNQDMAALLAFGRAVLPKVNEELATSNAVPFVKAQTTLDALLDDPREVRRAWSDDLHLSRYGYYLLARTVFFELLRMPEFAVAAEHAPGPEELDARFPEISLWRPADGMGWAKDKDSLVTPVLKALNLKDSKANAEGWGFFAPEDNRSPGELLLIPPERERCRLFSRIQSVNDSVSVFQVCPQGESTLLFEHKKLAEDGLWTPETAWHEIFLHAGGECGIVVRLQGENAQLWHKAEGVLFAAE